MASPQIKTPAEIIFDNTPSASASTPASGQTLLGVDETTKKLYSVNDAGVKTDYDAGGGGGGGSGIMGQDEGAPIGTGTILNVTGNLLQLSISGSVLRLNQTDPTFPQEVIGIYGQNQGVPLGTGNVLNVDGSRLSLSISGSVLRLTNYPDPQELIGILGKNQGENLGTGTTIDWGLGMNAAITGSVLFVHPFAGGSHNDLWTRNTGSVQGAEWKGLEEETLHTTGSTSITPTGRSRRNYLEISSLGFNTTINAPSGNARNGNMLLMRIEDNGVAKIVAYNSIFRQVGTTLVTGTTAGKVIYELARYNSADSKWDIISVTEEA